MFRAAFFKSETAKPEMAGVLLQGPLCLVFRAAFFKSETAKPEMAGLLLQGPLNLALPYAERVPEAPSLDPRLRKTWNPWL